MSIKMNMDLDWRFHLGDAADAGFMGYDDRAWRRVTLPHDWAVEHPFDPSHASGTGYLPGGTAWYRKHFSLDESAMGKRVRLTFQGVYKHAKVWINSNYLGNHAYGYTSFSFDISPFVKAGENVIAVRVEHNDVADSRWYTGSGIDRHVTLEISGQAAFEEYGLFVSTKEADENRAVLRLQYSAPGAQQVRFTLTDGTEKNAVKMTGGDGGTVEMTVENPRLWSPASPFLYRLIGTVLVQGEAVDTVMVPVGIRSFRFDPDQGFFLNGEPMKIKGVCVHHDGDEVVGGDGHAGLDVNGGLSEKDLIDPFESRNAETALSDKDSRLP